MGVLDRFERGIERAVNGAFARAFRSEVQPVELASALRREADDRAAVVARGRTLVPNAYVVQLGESDHARAAEWGEALSDELVSALREHAEHQRYSFVGPVSVAFEEAEDLDTGVFRVRSASVKGAVAPVARGASTGSRPVLDVDGQRYALSSTTTTIGRSSDADVVLDDPGVSRRHAVLRVTESGVLLEDLGSTNGTFLDGERITSARVFDGSTITVGRSRVVVRLRSAADAAGEDG